MSHNDPQNPDEDTEVTLSNEALCALGEFYAEQAVEPSHSVHGIHRFRENWHMSQFWYDETTRAKLATLLLDYIRMDYRIAILSAPSVYVKLDDLIRLHHREPCAKGVSLDRLIRQVSLLEYDARFACYESYVNFDYRTFTQSQTRHAFQHTFDVILADPPHLSEDCHTRYSACIATLARRYKTGTGTKPRVIVCTGLKMLDFVERLASENHNVHENGYAGLNLTSFTPQHTSNLANAFACFANFAPFPIP